MRETPTAPGACRSHPARGSGLPRRSRVEPLRDGRGLGGAGSDGGETIWLEGEAGRRILGCFGIPAASGTGEGVVAGSDSLSARLEVRSDPSFGPLLHLLPAGKPPLVRITPLTDRDIRELAAAAGLPAECSIEELLGRVSQLVEELPWLSRMAAEIRCARDTAGSWRLALEPGARLGLAAPATAKGGQR